MLNLIQAYIISVISLFLSGFLPGQGANYPSNTIWRNNNTTGYVMGFPVSPDTGPPIERSSSNYVDEAQDFGVFTF